MSTHAGREQGQALEHKHDRLLVRELGLLGDLVLARDSLVPRRSQPVRRHALLVDPAVLVAVDHEPLLPRQLHRRGHRHLGARLCARAVAPHVLGSVRVRGNVPGSPTGQTC